MTPEWDFEKAKEAMEEGIAKAERAAHEAWKNNALEVAYGLASSEPQIIAEQILQHVGSTRENRALGPIMKNAQKEGWIEPTFQFVKGTSVSRHYADVRVWRSKLYGTD